MRLTHRVTPVGRFPLSISGRHIADGYGSPFLLIGDALWSLEVQPTSYAQIDTIIESRAAKGYTAIMMEAFEHDYSDQTPKWQAALNSTIPFTTTANSASMTWTSRTDSYWQIIDYIVNKAKALDMAVVINPAYLGYGGGTDGWTSAVSAASDADMQNYGAFLANRYTQGNVIWCVGGDDCGDSGALTPGTVRTKQWQIMVGVRSVRTTDLITGHTGRSTTGLPADGEAHKAWNTFTGFNLNNIYGAGDATDTYSLCATAYARGSVFFAIEGPYEDQGGSDGSAAMRIYAWQSVLSGACGVFGGQFPRWALGAAVITNGAGVADCVTNDLNTAGDAEMGYIASLLGAYSWWLLVPKTDTTLVTTSLGTGTSRVCPALASDGTFGMVYVPASQTVTLDKTAFTPSLVRVRLYNPTTGAFTTHTASTANTGTLDVATGGERVIVVDAA